MGCYKSTEGCLDDLAANYDVGADNDCDQCCTYPKIRLTIDHLWSGEKFVFGDTLINDNGNQIVFSDQKMYLSNFKYILDDGAQVGNRDSVNLKIGNDSLNYARDIALVLKNQPSVSLHSYRSEGMLDKVSFRLGIDNTFDDIDEVQADKYSPLDFSNNMRESGSYLSFKLTLIHGPTLTDTVSYSIPEDYDFNMTKSIEILKGRDLSIPIAINYDLWLKDIDFIVDDKDTILSKLKNNTTKSFE